MRTRKFSIISKISLSLPKFNFTIKTFWNDGIRLRAGKCVASPYKSRIYRPKKYLPYSDSVQPAGSPTVAQYNNADSSAVAIGTAQQWLSAALLTHLQWLSTSLLIFFKLFHLYSPDPNYSVSKGIAWSLENAFECKWKWACLLQSQGHATQNTREVILPPLTNTCVNAP